MSLVREAMRVRGLGLERLLPLVVGAQAIVVGRERAVRGARLVADRAAAEERAQRVADARADLVVFAEVVVEAELREARERPHVLERVLRGGDERVRRRVEV